MTKLTQDDILHIAKLAKLEITSEEIAKFTPQLENVIEFVGQLNEVDTKNVTPTSQTTGLTNVTRTDSPKTVNVLGQDAALSGSDSFYNGYFKVKAILEGRSDK